MVKKRQLIISYDRKTKKPFVWVAQNEISSFRQSMSDLQISATESKSKLLEVRFLFEDEVEIKKVISQFEILSAN